MMTPQGLWNGPGSSDYSGVIIERSDQLRSKLITNHRKRSYVAALLTSGWISLNYPAQHCVVCLPELQIMLKSPFHQGLVCKGGRCLGSRVPRIWKGEIWSDSERSQDLHPLSYSELPSGILYWQPNLGPSGNRETWSAVPQLQHHRVDCRRVGSEQRDESPAHACS